jgi:hypothetical protein
LTDLRKRLSPFAHSPGFGEEDGVRTLALLGVLAMAQSVRAQGYPAEMVISLPEVEVRSGPTTKCYPTSKLKYGDRVWVQSQSKEPGWLVITPPAGSFSWIDAKQIKQIDAHTGIVDVEGGAMVLIGSSLVNDAPNKESVKIPYGSQVTIFGNGVSKDGTTWLPIKNWPTEVRYIPGEAVQTRQFAAASTTTPNNSGTAAPGRLASLSQSTWTPSQAPGHPAQMTQTTSWATGQTASLSQPSPAQPALTLPPQWSQVGVLRRTDFKTDGQPTYVLEDSRGRPLMYATCLAGMTLRDYVGRTVALYGTVNYRSDDYLRIHVMTASHVAAY